MLIAQDRKGERHFGPDSEKDKDYFCPQCDEMVILKKGTKVIHHFAHHPFQDCEWWEPESQLHLEMKLFIKNLFEKQWSNYSKIVELEYRISNLYADVYVETVTGLKIAIECQVSYKPIQKIIEKTKIYSDNDIYTWWIFSGHTKKMHHECLDHFDNLIFKYGGKCLWGVTRSIMNKRTATFHLRYRNELITTNSDIMLISATIPKKIRMAHLTEYYGIKSRDSPLFMTSRFRIPICYICGCQIPNLSVSYTSRISDFPPVCGDVCGLEYQRMLLDDLRVIS